ncbi:MAG: TonB-dependent receptor domain-containing protein [Bacteroidales bacterium]
MFNSILLASLISVSSADTIKLSSHHLDEVIVTDKLPLSSLNLDTRRVGPDIAQPVAMMSVNDLLSMTPSVDTDIEGNVYVRNSDKLAFLLNGIPLGYLQENRGDILLQIPSSMLHEIRVLSNPSVQLIPDGTAGIIDFRTRSLSSGLNSDKKTKQALSLDFGSHGRVGADYFIDAKPSEKFKFNAGIQTKQDYRSREFKNKTIFFDTKSYEEQNNDASAYPWINSILFSAEYKVKPYLRFQMSADGLLADYDRIGNIRNDKYKDGEKEPLSKARVTRYNDQSFATASVQLKAFIDLPEDMRHSFAVDANYRYYEKLERNRFNRRPKPDMFVQDSSAYSTYSNDIYLALNHRFYENYKTRSNSRLALAVHSGFDFRNDNSSIISSKDYLKPVKPSARDLFNSIRSVYGIYTQAEVKVGNWIAEAGLRGEYTRLNQFDPEKEKRFNKDYFDLYPRVALAFNYKSSQWRLYYSKRVNRPLLTELNPSVNNSDPTRLFIGNPNLKPEYANNLSLGYRLAGLNWYLMPQLFYSCINHSITDVYLDNNLVTKENLSKSANMGAELSFVYNPAWWFDMSISGFIARNQIDGRSIGFEEKKKNLTGGVQSAVTFHPLKSMDIQVSGNYISDRITLQGTIHERYRLNASLTQRFWSDRLHVSLSVSDIFNSMGEKTTIETASFHKTIRRERDPQVIMCGLKIVI